MKIVKRIKFKVLFTLTGLLIGVNTIQAQQKDTLTLDKILSSMPKYVYKHPSYADSLMQRFENIIDSVYYDYHFWGKGITHQFTMLQILIDKHGKVKRIWFSDSADKIFVDAFFQQTKSLNKIEIETLEKYTKAKRYKNISILIPVYFETRFERHPSFEHNYNFMESIMKFDGKPFLGKSVILEPVIIRVLAEHNG
jgi:hypothetical protein